MEAVLTDPATTTLEALMERTAAGDRRAFAELYDRMAPRVLGLAARLLMDRSHAEEVAQEVFLETWQKAARFDSSKGAAVPWMLTLTRTRAIDRIRSEQSARERLFAIGVRDYEDEVPDVADDLARTDEGSRAMASLYLLTERQREAVELFSGGRSHREIANQLGVPVNTAKTRVRDGLERLRRELAPELAMA